REELGRPLSEVFDRFDDQPIAAASIGQVHRARLRQEKVEVVVKVQRPSVEITFRSDLAWIRRLVHTFHRLGLWPHMRWKDLILELDEIVLEEVDYRYELAAARRMRWVLRSHDIYVPKTFRAYTSRRVLVQEYIAGVTMSEYVTILRHTPEIAQA